MFTPSKLQHKFHSGGLWSWCPCSEAKSPPARYRGDFWRHQRLMCGLMVAGTLWGPRSGALHSQMFIACPQSRPECCLWPRRVGFGCFVAAFGGFQPRSLRSGARVGVRAGWGLLQWFSRAGVVLKAHLPSSKDKTRIAADEENVLGYEDSSHGLGILL